MSTCATEHRRQSRCPRARGGHPCKSRRCPHCGPIWAGDQRAKLFANFDFYGDGDGKVSLFTITAPGVEVLPWDLQNCGHKLGQCSGKLGCRVTVEAARRWNARAPRNWSKMHRAAAQYVRRRMPRQLKILGYVWQYQGRGVLHIHVVLGVGTPAHRHAAALYMERVRAAHEKHGFGWPDRKMSSRAGQRAAAYLSSYLIVGKGSKAVLQETTTREDCPPMLVYVSRELTSATGITMRSLRRRRYEWCQLHRDGAVVITRDMAVSLIGEDQVRDLELARGP